MLLIYEHEYYSYEVLNFSNDVVGCNIVEGEEIISN